MGKKGLRPITGTVAGWKVGTILNYEDYDGGRVPNFAGVKGFTPRWLMKFIQYEILKYYPDQDWRDWETHFLARTDCEMSFEAIDPLTAQRADMNLYTAFNRLDERRTEIGIEFRFLTYDHSRPYWDYQKQAAIYFQITDGWISPVEILIGDKQGKSTSYVPPYKLKIKLPAGDHRRVRSANEMLHMEVKKRFLYWSINHSEPAKIVDKQQST